MEAFHKSPIHLKSMESLKQPLLEIKKEYETHMRYYSQRIAGSFMVILASIAREISFVSAKKDKGEHIANLVINYILEHYHTEINSQTLGSIFHFHPNYINRLMVRHTGLSTHQYLLMYRITQAISLIQTTNLSISQIAYEAGFRDMKHFSNAFKHRTGKSPMKFRMI